MAILAILFKYLFNQTLVKSDPKKKTLVINMENEGNHLPETEE